MTFFNICHSNSLFTYFATVARFSLIYGIYTAHSLQVAQFKLIYGIYTVYLLQVAQFSLI
ncbi:hypothetical protein [Paenibacillus odorifer]|uniref:hypothetical protein n=1 Tax=Paenibacillus odorifer TaxID=189426 RepID=UPI002DB5DFC6|nr:hypothetical protein [Paenibacillus odorifer]MEC0130888.1 hypothetical protein [Paenibacillus odorifer]